MRLHEIISPTDLFGVIRNSTEFANIASSINYDTLDPNWKEKYNQLVNYFNS